MKIYSTSPDSKVSIGMPQRAASDTTGAAMKTAAGQKNTWVIIANNKTILK